MKLQNFRFIVFLLNIERPTSISHPSLKAPKSNRELICRSNTRIELSENGLANHRASTAKHR